MRAGGKKAWPARWPRWRLLAAFVTTMVTVIAVAAAATVTSAQVTGQLKADVAELFSSYNRTTGRIGDSWWQSAIVLSTIEAYQQATGDTSYELVIPVSFAYYARTDFEDAYNDDTGWWGLAWLQAYRLTRSRLPQARVYLKMAEKDADYMHKSWDDACGGGVWWTTRKTYKNAITNEIFLELTAWLHNSIPGDTKYLRWARAEWAWFRRSGLINGHDLVNDGLDGQCGNNGQATWTYNQGVILAGLGQLYLATGNIGQLNQAEAIARSAISKLTVRGVLREPCEDPGCGDDPGDVQSFKGIFIRGLKVLADIAGTSQFNGFFRTQARSVADNDTFAGDRLGFRWQGPATGLSTASQASGVDAIVASLGLP